MPIASREDVQLYYEIQGTGEPLLLIMGLSLNSLSWYRSLPLLTEHFQVILFDNRGVGRSSKPDYPYTTDMMARDACSILDHAGIETAHVYGISMGGMIAQRFATLFPERVRTLVLGCTSPGGIYQFQPAVEAVQIFLRYAFLSTEQLARACIPILYSKQFVEQFQEVVNQDIEQMLTIPTPTSSFLHQLEACLRHDSYGDLAQIQAPTLILHGQKDILLPYGNAEVLCTNIPNSTLITYPDAGHMFFSEVGAEADQEIIHFIQKIT